MGSIFNYKSLKCSKLNFPSLLKVKSIKTQKMKRTLNAILFIAILFMVFRVDNINAQDQSEISDSIYSKELGEMRTLKIKIPENFKPGSADKFEVIYITDGEWSMEMFSNIYKFTMNEKYIPQVILVAIPNTYIAGRNMRDRDFLPVQIKDNQLAGGADKFIAFLKNELIPYIDKKYPTNGSNSLYGHSYGGLFSMYVLLSHPEIFNTYYSLDPSFWWNNNYLCNLAAEKFDKTPELDKTLWIGGIVETFKNMGIDVMDSVLKAKAPNKLYWKFDAYPNESHGSMRLKGIYDGLKFNYDGFSVSSISFHPMAGILLKDKPTKIFLNGKYPNVRYTTDGSEPNVNSEQAAQLFEIKGPAKFVIKSFGGNERYGSISKGNFELGEVLPAIQKIKNAKSGGFKYSYYEGKWDSLPDFSKLKPIKTGITDSTFSVGKIKSQTNFACLIEGYLKVETEGYYSFGLDSDDGSKFYLNGKLLISNDGLHPTGNFKSYVVPLQKGFYPVRIEFFQGEGGLDLQLVYLLPETQRPIGIPNNLQYYRN